MIGHPLLVRHARYRWDAIRQQHQLVYPEGILILNASATAIVRLCDGRPLEQLLADLHEQFADEVSEAEVLEFLERLAGKGLLRDAPNP
jgi:coenzyme PQQ biosynthesis protein PqqD